MNQTQYESRTNINLIKSKIESYTWNHRAPHGFSKLRRFPPLPLPPFNAALKPVRLMTTNAYRPLRLSRQGKPAVTDHHCSALTHDQRLRVFPAVYTVNRSECHQLLRQRLIRVVVTQWRLLPTRTAAAT